MPFIFTKILFCLTVIYSTCANADLSQDLKHLQQAYPGTFQLSTDQQYLIWKDGTKMAVSDNKPNKTWYEKLNKPSLADQITHINYPAGKIDLQAAWTGKKDPGRIRFEPFFKAMYGHTEAEVRDHLTTIPWMPNTFKNNKFTAKYQIQVTTVNNIHQKIKNISDELDILVQQHPEYIAYLDIGSNGGSFSWRKIAFTNRISNHSFGMTMDINPKAPYADYWQRNLPKDAVLNTQGQENSALIQYRNQVPWPIVLLFEKYKFIWGGKWYHYDTMHFEYRPELF